MERSLGASAVGLLPSPLGSHDAGDQTLRGDDIMAELARGLHPRERPDWEETISAMARSAEVPDLRASSTTSSTSTTAGMKVKTAKKLSFSKGHFPKLAECAHFHYENVDFGTLQLSLADEHSEVTRNGLESKECVYLVQIHCQGRNWIVRRSYEDFCILDKHLHLCIYDRGYSQLAELPSDQPEGVSQMLIGYLTRLSAIADNKINCGPALTWMELDNKGNHLLVHEESSINVPAIAAAHVIKRYNAQAPDELSFEVGDIVSVIDMPPKEDTTWWRGKHGFQVGFFPSECVELINDKIPQSVTNCVPKPDLEMETVIQQDTNMNSVSKKHGKLITFLRTFMKSRPSKQKLKQRGILKERVFACDLGEHLLNSGQDVPQVLRSCAEFIEKHGIVDGIYRLSGIASNIQKLRHEFDSELIPDLTKEIYIQDIHCVGSLCKLYFRELPNPLLTYQLYDKFSEAVSAATDDERLIKIHDVIQQLPPPHYRTLEFLMKHLSRLATFSSITNMHAKNLAIVWAPNLLRSRQIESACFGGPAAFMEVRIQSVVVEFILSHVDMLFGPKLTGQSGASRPKSVLGGGWCASARLLSLEEAQARTQAQICSPITPHSRYIEVGEGPAALLGKFHTVIDFPTDRKRQPIKSRKSPVGSWRSFFSLGKSSSSSSSSSSATINKRKLRRNPSEPTELKSMALTGGRGETGTLRSAKSEESLTSLHNVEGESKMYRPRRPRSSSDALSSSFGADLLAGQQHCASYDNLCNAAQPGHHHHEHDDSDQDDRPIFCVPALISSPPIAMETDLELMPPEVGMATLDFDPMSFGLGSPLMSDRETALLSSATEDRMEDGQFSAAQQTPDRSYSAAESTFVTAPSPSVDTPPLSPPPRVRSAESVRNEPVNTDLGSVRNEPVSAKVESVQNEPVSAKVESVRNEALLLDLMGSPLHTVTMETHFIQHPADLDFTRELQLQSPVVLSSALSCAPAARKLAFALEELESPLVAAETSRSCDTPSPLSPLRADDLLSSLDWPVPPSLASETSITTATPTPAPTSLQRTPSSTSPERPAPPEQIDSQTDPPDDSRDDWYALPDQPALPPQSATAATDITTSAQATPVHHQTTLPAVTQVPSAFNEAPPTLNQTTHVMTTLTETTPTQFTPTHVKATPTSSVPASPLSSPEHQSAAVGPAQISTVPAPVLEDHTPLPSASAGPSSSDVAPTQGITAAPCSAVATGVSAPSTSAVAQGVTASSASAFAQGIIAPPTFAVAQGVICPPTSAVAQGVICPPTSAVAQGVIAPPASAVAQGVIAPHTFAVARGVPASAVFAAPSSSSRERSCVSPPGPEPQVAVAVPSLPHAPPWASEHPVAVLQPQPQTPQPQPRAPLGPSLDKPWEAIKPVQPWLESAPYHHHHHQQQQQQQQQPSPAGPAPPPPVRSIESKLATATLGRDGSAYHAFLEDEGSAMTMTMSHTLPRKSAYVYHAQGPVAPPADAYYPPARALPVAYAYRAEPLPMSYAADVSRYATIGPRSYHHSLKTHRPTRAEYLPSPGPTPSPGPAHHHHHHHHHPRSHGYSHVGATYPSIRRVHSLHAPSLHSPSPSSTAAAVRGPPVSRTEVPPPQASSDEEMFYYQRSAHRCRGYAPPAAEPPDYHVTRLQPFFENGRVQYRYSPHSEQLAPDAPSYYELDPYATLRLRHFHSFGGRDREAKSGAYHYLLHQRHSPQPPHHAAGVREHGFVSRDMPPAHLHAPQGPGGACLPSWEAQEEAERLRGHSLRRESRARQRLKGPVLSQYDNLGPYMPPDAPAGPPHTPATESLQHLRSKSDPGKEARYNVTPEAAVPRSLTADPDAFLYMETEKHAHAGPRPAGPRSHTPSSQPHGLQHVPEASRLSDADRAAHRGGRSPEGESLQRVTATVTPKPERSHSRGPWGPEPDPHPRPPQRHTPSGVPSHYDNLEEYRPPATTQTQTRPAPKDPLASRGGAALFPGQAFGHGHGGRAYSTALGQGAFIQTDAPLHRPEAEVKAE
ncbi:rho GTPase-activating protein 32 isoform X2 [Alosa sapidissima]|uniref:rho GTPase-activating protein 32 isoform X2 n=1 Tax=Alosa sapidissima TaxID=34773 RepID=UPI001C093B89|nr:rho GTPase-activating protein 32 isoform X2 [Alosa sapidissima]